MPHATCDLVHDRCCIVRVLRGAGCMPGRFAHALEWLRRAKQGARDMNSQLFDEAAGKLDGKVDLLMANPHAQRQDESTALGPNGRCGQTRQLEQREQRGAVRARRCQRLRERVRARINARARPHDGPTTVRMRPRISGAPRQPPKPPCLLQYVETELKVAQLHVPARETDWTFAHRPQEIASLTRPTRTVDPS